MIINILVGIIIVLLYKVYVIQGRVKRRLMVLEKILGSNQSNRDMILRGNMNIKTNRYSNYK